MAETFINHLIDTGTPPHGTMSDMTVILDGQIYERLRFVNCELVYQGGLVPIMRNNQFVNCRWRVDGAALNTLDFFRMLVGTGLGEMVKESMGLPKNG